MNFFKKLATPFIAIGRWIKETAWVQPLLIVGAIFAVIFSIPSITSAIQKAIEESASDILWYKNYQLSLDGTYYEYQDSEANIFFDNYVEAQAAWNSGDKETAREIINKYSDNTGKMFLFFVQSNCSACSETKEAAVYLTDNWDSLIPNTYTPFKYQSIICDEEVDEDEYDKYEPFEYLTGNHNYLSFTEDCNAVGINNYYYYNTTSSNQSTIKTNLEGLINDETEFQTPLVVLIDTTETNENDQYIISTLFYKCTGSDKYERSDFLADCWTNDGLFSKDYEE